MATNFEFSVMRKVAWRLVPFLSLAYLINALDRFNVSIAALTMNKALGLSATTYGLAAGAFFWSYVLFQLPASAILTRLGARRWLGITMVVWGICSAGTAFVSDANSFVAMRFLLGIAESGFFPGVAWFMTRWFPSRHRGTCHGRLLCLRRQRQRHRRPAVGQPSAAGGLARPRRMAMGVPDRGRSRLPAGRALPDPDARPTRRTPPG